MFIFQTFGQEENEMEKMDLETKTTQTFESWSLTGNRYHRRSAIAALQSVGMSTELEIYVEDLKVEIFSRQGYNPMITAGKAVGTMNSNGVKLRNKKWEVILIPCDEHRVIGEEITLPDGQYGPGIEMFGNASVPDAIKWDSRWIFSGGFHPGSAHFWTEVISRLPLPEDGALMDIYVHPKGA